MKYLISGGGTGGHIFPAVSIANALKELDPEAEILFIGALGRMEMERVPQAGYKIIGLPVRGFNRAQPWKNVSVLIDLAKSIRQVKSIIRDFQPNVGVGVGGYASGAAMWAAANMGIPILLQEQNGFAGVTNKLLKNDARKICVAYEGMEQFFPKDKILLTGNPVRQDLTSGDKERGVKYFNEHYPVHFTADRPTLLVLGGSLGARNMNRSVLAAFNTIVESDIQVIWQTGKYYYDECIKGLEAEKNNNDVKEPNIVCTPFLSNMPDCYALATVVASRAGASSISEICLLGKPSILVPSPNVAEDHQTHNAMALVKKNAAVYIPDADADRSLIHKAVELIKAPEKLKTLSDNALTLGKPDSAKQIAGEVIKLAKNK